MISFAFSKTWFPSQLNNHLLGISGVTWTELIIIYKLFSKIISAQWLGLLVKCMKIFSLYVCTPAGWNIEWFPFGVIEAVFKFRMLSKKNYKRLAPFQALQYWVAMASIIFLSKPPLLVLLLPHGFQTAVQAFPGITTQNCSAT